MKNKKYILTIITAVILSACNLGKNKPDAEIQKKDKLDKKSLNFSGEPAVKIGKSVSERLAELPENAEFFGYNGNLDKDSDGKLKYRLSVNKNDVSIYDAIFTKDDFKQEGEFDVTDFKKAEVSVDSNDYYYNEKIEKDDTKTKIKIPRTDLTYGDYGFFEAEYDILLKYRYAGDYHNDYYKNLKGKILKPFFIGRADKIKFEPPEKDIKFSGLTHAVLNKGYDEEVKKIKDLKGRAEMIIRANSSKGDIIFKYDNWDKVVKVTGYDFVNRDDKYKLEVSGLKVYEKDNSLKGYIFDNKEAIGTYELDMTDGINGFSLDGGFGMRKQ